MKTYTAIFLLFIMACPMLQAEDIAIDTDPVLKASDIGVFKAAFKVQHAKDEVVICMSDHQTTDEKRFVQYSVNYRDNGVWEDSFAVITDYLINISIHKIIVKDPVASERRYDIDESKTYSFSQLNNTVKFTIDDKKGTKSFTVSLRKMKYKDAMALFKMPDLLAVPGARLFSWNSSTYVEPINLDAGK